MFRLVDVQPRTVNVFSFGSTLAAVVLTFTSLDLAVPSAILLMAAVIRAGSPWRTNDTVLSVLFLVVPARLKRMARLRIIARKPTFCTFPLTRPKTAFGVGESADNAADEGTRKARTRAAW